MSLPRYPEYKDSGVPWIGGVPSHWNVHQTKRHFQRRKELNLGMACEYRLALTMNGVVPRSLDDLDGLQSSDFEGYQIFEPGDLAFKLIDLQNIKTSRVGLVPERGIMSPAYIRLCPLITTNERFAYWYFMALYWMQVFNSLGGGVRQTLGPEELLTVEYPLPSLVEQTAIATFLDHETGKIDALIAEQDQLIALLAEKRQATISHAVTKGLNPDAPLKDSGVEWLGDVPAHWELRQLKTVSTFTTSGPRGWSDRISEDGSLFIQSGDLNDAMGVDFSTAKRVVVENDAEAIRTQLFDGDVVVCITGAKTGNVAVCSSVPEPSYVNQHLCLIRLKEMVYPAFMAAQLKSRVGQTQFELSQYGLKQGLSLENVRETLVVLPAIQEQTAIVAYLDTEIAKLDVLKAESESAVALLKERRAALISAAVTGQIDVRSAA